MSLCFRTVKRRRGKKKGKVREKKKCGKRKSGRLYAQYLFILICNKKKEKMLIKMSFKLNKNPHQKFFSPVTALPPQTFPPPEG